MQILHGDDIVASRKELSLIKERNKDKEIIVFDGKNLDLNKITIALEARSLLENEKLVIIENLLSLQKGRLAKNNPFLKIVEYLNQCLNSDNLLLWENREISKSCLSLFNQSGVKLFKIPRLIFSLVESIKPANSQLMINLFRQCLTNPPEIVYSMIVRQFRFLLLIKSQTNACPADYQKLAPWQRQRLTNQAKLFTIEGLVGIYQQLLLIDYQNKTGQAVFDLAKTLELLLVKI